MPLTLEGDFKIGRELMKEDRKRHMSRIRSLEKKHDRSVKNGGMGLTASEHKELNQLYKLVRYRSVSSLLPAKIDGITINVKLLQSFMRKLGSSFICSISVVDNKLILEYRKNTNQSNKGVLELVDISQHFKNFTDVPTLKIAEGVYHA